MIKKKEIKERRYNTSKCRPLEKWLKNDILLQHDKVKANVVYFDESLRLC